MVNLLSFKLAEYIDAQGKPRPFFEMINVFDRDGRQWTTSLNVAEVFDREHKDVLDKIDNCLCSQEFSRRNFTPSDYIDSKINVFERDGRQWTTSLNVAEVFDTPHDEILKRIRNCQCSEQFSLVNFHETSYKDKFNRDQKCFDLSRDGFSFLVMGFTVI